MHGLSLTRKFAPVALYEQEDYDERYDVCYVWPYPFREFQAFACICLVHKVIPAPAVPACTEQHIDEAAQREQVVADDEVFQIQDRGSLAERCESAQHVVAQHARHGQDQDSYEIDGYGFLPGASGQVHGECNDVLEYGDDRGCRGEEHAEEEDRAPQSSACHGVEDIRQGDEDQVRSAVRVYAEREAGREDDQSGDQRHTSVKHGDRHDFSRESSFLLNIASENGHGADAEAQSKERLVHSRRHDFHDARFFHLAEIRQQIELKACHRSGQENGTDRQDDQQDEEHDHHDLGNAFHTFLESQIYNGKTQNDNHCHAYGHEHRLPHQASELALDLCRIHAFKASRRHLKQIDQKPSADSRIEHHQQIVSGDAEPFIPVPFCPQRLQPVERLRDTAACGASHGELHYHDRESQQHQAAQIDQHKCRPAVLSRDIRETPYISKSDRAARRDQDEPDTGAEFFSFHQLLSSFPLN